MSLSCTWIDCVNKCDHFEQVGDYDNDIITVCSDCVKKDVYNGDCRECDKCKWRSYDYMFIKETSWGVYWCQNCVEEDKD